MDGEMVWRDGVKCMDGEMVWQIVGRVQDRSPKPLNPDLGFGKSIRGQGRCMLGIGSVQMFGFVSGQSAAGCSSSSLRVPGRRLCHVILELLHGEPAQLAHVREALCL